MFMAEGANKWSICPANKVVVVSPEGNVEMLARYHPLGGGGRGNSPAVCGLTAYWKSMRIHPGSHSWD